jgi:phosphoenolpyruvate carboxykinase (ATP)
MMDARPLLSVVIPVYNEAGTIEAILSRVAATAHDKEIIVVDDASTDGSREYLESVDRGEAIVRDAAGDPARVRILFQPENRGKGAALRRGFEAATGSILLVQDADLEYDPKDYDVLAGHAAEFTILHAPNLEADPADGTGSGAFVLVDLSRGLILIGGTQYAGEIKKSIFSVMNWLMPRRAVLPMHCSANVGRDGNTALFFGLSGTGKTTLSADPERRLIGDDEHGWSTNGVFNFEGGCYAKCIRLSQEKEPEIWAAIRFGSVVENVVVDPATRTVDYDDDSITENTRVAYPVDFIPNAMIPGIGGHPRTIVFLTADAFGVLPPIARLSRDQAMYHFISGYTAKVAGTEAGVTEPKATFSACFGAPFLPLHPSRYAEKLGKRLDQHDTVVWLVNTGWTGGPYGEGRRMDLKHTRAMVSAAISGELNRVSYSPHPVFRVEVPKKVPGVPDRVLDPRSTWEDGAAYDAKASQLADLFRKNFEKFGDVASEIAKAGPRAAR